jgi:hypothetical protein
MKKEDEEQDEVTKGQEEPEIDNEGLLEGLGDKVDDPAVFVESHVENPDILNIDDVTLDSGQVQEQSEGGFLGDALSLSNPIEGAETAGGRFSTEEERRKKEQGGIQEDSSPGQFYEERENEDRRERERERRMAGEEVANVERVVNAGEIDAPHVGGIDSGFRDVRMMSGGGGSSGEGNYNIERPTDVGVEIGRTVQNPGQIPDTAKKYKGRV